VPLLNEYHEREGFAQPPSDSFEPPNRRQKKCSGLIRDHLDFELTRDVDSNRRKQCTLVLQRD
jgi:hypothetical protein